MEGTLVYIVELEQPWENYTAVISEVKEKTVVVEVEDSEGSVEYREVLKSLVCDVDTLENIF